ncbi:cell cycle checkpoint control protein RAD9B isoform X1 [Monodelphis domestica]|uniref:cell cycle checkpoint control protein RAD9B isoform X1 n=1 Tax=Monodelphis domestica TaxID=13616 RepID=UPI000443492B|nr:cell cycle checkpoint control protein RAD9B isoform X1 [Monodelphis domestica]
MKCEMDGHHVKVFGRAIHALARISEELWLDPTERGLAVRSVNSSRSAYASVLFPTTFFQLYQWSATHEIGDSNMSTHLKCQLGMKSILPIFRCLNTLERNVEKCRIFISANTCHVIFQLFCKHGIIKTHNLSFQESEPLQAVFAKNMCPNILKVQSRLLADIMIHFPSSQEEITLAVTPMKVCFKSYLEDEIDFGRSMHTEMHLDPEEFDYFQVGIDTEVTFCLKELRGLLAFSEATTAPVSIYFDLSGKPVAFSIDEIVLEATFVLATLADIQSGTSSPSSLCFSQRLKRSDLIKYKSGTEGNLTNREKESAIVKAASKRPADSERHITSNELESLSVPAVKRLETHMARTTENNLSAMEEVMPKTQVYNKFCSLFFGAISRKPQDSNQPGIHRTRATDIEEDVNDGRLSPVF